MSDRDSTLLSEYVSNIVTDHDKSLKLVHLNAQSLCDTAHQSEFLDTFSNCEIDVITVSETWFKDTDQFCLPGYSMYNINRKRRNGGGVAVFVKSCYRVKVLTASTGEFDKPEYILLDVLIGSVKILFAGIYRRPKAGYMNLFIDDIYKYVTNFKYCFVCGDINAGFGRGGEDTKMISEALDMCNLQCVPFQPTFHTSTCDSNLDIIASNCSELLITHGQTPASGFSAHDLIFAVYDLSVPRFVKKASGFRNFSSIVPEILLDDVEKAPWQEVFNEGHIDRKLTSFNSIVTQLMDKHAPYQTREIKRPSVPWMSNDIRILIRKRNKFRKKWKRTRCPTDLENFRQMRNRVKQVIRSAKSKYYYERFANNSNPKKLWSDVRSLNISKQASQSTEPVMSVDTLNSHYASVSTVNNATMVHSCINNYKGRNQFKPENTEKFHFKYALPGDIVEAINSIKSNATGADLIPITFIKLCLPALLPVIEHLFNFSLQNSCFPEMWKLANIIPIPKVKDPKECKDYRPVSILCVLGKALEKIVHKQVTEFMNAHNLFTLNQSGFRKGHSTETALLKVTDDIRRAIDKRLLTLLLLLDLSKAFDCVHHELLIVKLKYLGFSDAVINWFKSYLTKRQHRVFVSDVLVSSWVEIAAGVPQGSVLGPLLFLIYLFDLPSVIINCSYHMYADDIQLYIHFPLQSFGNFLALLSYDLSRVIDFCSSHNLILNVSKTQAIIIGTQRYLTMLYDKAITPLVIKDCVIPYSKKVCNLGVIFDSTLSWTEHCVLLVQKVFGILAQLRRNISFIPHNIRRLLVTSLIMPHIDYASVLFTDISDTNQLKLQRLQNACIRFITGTSRFDHITPHYKQLGILKLRERRILSIAILAWKIMKYCTPAYLFTSYTFVPKNDERETRSSKHRLSIPIHRTEKYHLSFLIQSSKLWNEFELHNYTHMSINSFREIMYKRVLNSCLRQ